jgi:crotonobetainyl-CoA:carnitine CoA-transferase CaiB-like acyl-CoA transferase
VTAELGQLWTTLTGDQLASGVVQITGEESVLPGPFRVATAAAASIAAATLAAGELLRLRGIEPGVVSVDTRHAAAAFHSERYLRVNGESPGDVWAELSGDYRASDSWVRLHCNYPQHAASVCWALGVPPSRDAVAKAVAGWTARNVQDAVIWAGGAGAAMRDRAAWLAHPQGQVVAELPPVELRQIGSAPTRALFNAEHHAASGLRVLELTHVIAGPVAGRTLAAHGATVLHVGAAHLPTVAPLVVDTGMGKRSAYVDLSSDGGRARLRKLISRADVFIQSFRPNSLAKLGFSAEELVKLRPGLIVVDLSAYGWRGPWANRRGFDSLVQMASGIAAEGGLDQPRPLPLQALDHATGWLAAAAVMTAVKQQVLEGGSLHAKLSLAGTGMWLDSLGRKDPDGAEVDMSDLLQETPSQFGTLTHVRVPGTLPGGNPQWTHGSHLPGSDAPSW